LQNVSVSDLAKEISSLKAEIASLRRDLNILQQEVETGYPIDSWARQEINLIKERIESIPPPLEDAPFETLSKKNLHQNYKE
jgi:predicted RNase H-like nuclease (RuvC/YqgF family)